MGTAFLEGCFSCQHTGDGGLIKVLLEALLPVPLQTQQTAATNTEPNSADPCHRLPATCIACLPVQISVLLDVPAELKPFEGLCLELQGLQCTDGEVYCTPPADNSPACRCK